MFAAKLKAREVLILVIDSEVLVLILVLGIQVLIKITGSHGHLTIFLRRIQCTLCLKKSM